jgi:hypothetical protein
MRTPLLRTRLCGLLSIDYPIVNFLLAPPVDGASAIIRRLAEVGDA